MSTALLSPPVTMCIFPLTCLVQSQPAAQDSLDEFMTEIKSGCTLDSVARKKLHLRSFELRKEQQRLKALIKLVKPAELPELKPP